MANAFFTVVAENDLVASISRKEEGGLRKAKTFQHAAASLAPQELLEAAP